MNYNDIVARLQKGESMDVIAKEMEDALNKANAEYQAQEAKKKEAEDQKAKQEEKMTHAAEVITNGLGEYLDACGIDYGVLEVAEVRALLDEFAPLFEKLKDVEVKVSTKKPVAVKHAKSADDVFATLFKLMNW